MRAKRQVFVHQGSLLLFYFILPTFPPLVAPGFSYPHHPFTLLPPSLPPSLLPSLYPSNLIDLSLPCRPRTNIPSLSSSLFSFPSLSLLLSLYQKDLIEISLLCRPRTAGRVEDELVQARLVLVLDKVRREGGREGKGGKGGARVCVGVLGSSRRIHSFLLSSTSSSFLPPPSRTLPSLPPSLPSSPSPPSPSCRPATPPSLLLSPSPSPLAWVTTRWPWCIRG